MASRNKRITMIDRIKSKNIFLSKIKVPSFEGIERGLLNKLRITVLVNSDYKNIFPYEISSPSLGGI